MYLYTYENLLEKAKTEKGKDYIEKIRKCYEENYENKPITTLTFSKFKLFHLNGNRSEYEREYFDRRKRFMLLQVLALVDDKYLEALEDIIAAICDEITWCLPAHCLVRDKLTYNYEAIDLFASETALYLSETAYILKDRLSNEIKHRIEYSLKNRIVNVFETQEQSFERMGNNWLSVCACGIGTAYLYSFPERFDIVKDRIFGAMHKYINNLDPDGYCSEGLTYWVYGFGFFALFYDVYTQLTGEWPEILDSSTVKNSLKYAKNAVFGDNLFLTIADGGMYDMLWERTNVVIVDRLFNADVTINGEIRLPDRDVLGLRRLYCIDLREKESEFEKEDCYFENSQVLIKRKENYIFVSKGGNNGEMHNHNDIGAFSIFRNGKPYILDLGAGEYTNDYFGSAVKRYSKEIFVCSAYSHSIPVIDDTMQTWGKEYYATVLDRTDDYIVYDISKAYPLDVEDFTVKYSFLDNEVKALYNASNIKNNVTFRFVSIVEPKLENDKVYIDDMLITNSHSLSPVVEKVNYKNHAGEFVSAYVIDYKLNEKAVVEFNFSFQN